MIHQIVYDIRDENFNFWTFLLPLVFLWVIRFLVKKHFSLSFTFKLVFFLFHVISLIWFFYTFLEFRYLVKSLNSNNCDVVQGYITQFRPKSIFGKKPESFYVDSVYFEYSDSDITNGYNKTVGIGGKVKNGIKAKIFYKEDKILRFEIWDGSAP